MVSEAGGKHLTSWLLQLLIGTSVQVTKKHPAHWVDAPLAKNYVWGVVLFILPNTHGKNMQGTKIFS